MAFKSLLKSLIRLLSDSKADLADKTTFRWLASSEAYFADKTTHRMVSAIKIRTETQAQACAENPNDIEQVTPLHCDGEGPGVRKTQR